MRFIFIDLKVKKKINCSFLIAWRQRMECASFYQMSLMNIVRHDYNASQKVFTKQLSLADAQLETAFTTIILAWWNLQRKMDQTMFLPQIGQNANFSRAHGDSEKKVCRAFPVIFLSSTPFKYLKINSKHWSLQNWSQIWARKTTTNCFSQTQNKFQFNSNKFVFLH